MRVRARQLRDFVDVRDVVRAIDLAIKHPPETSRIYNIGTGQPTSVAELGELIRKVVGTTVPLIVDLSPNPESYVADPRRAADEAVSHYRERFKTIYRDAGESFSSAADKIADWVQGKR